MNKSGNLNYTGIISIGDWSEDGHNQYDMFEFLSSHSLEELQQGYKNSCVISHLRFDHEHMENKDPNAICVEYKSDVITEYQLQRLHQTFRLDISDIPENVENFSLMGINPKPKELAHIILWFSGQTLENFKFEITDRIKKSRDKSEEFFKKTFNGWWNKNLNVQFGYGIYADRSSSWGSSRFGGGIIKKLDETKKIFFNQNVRHFIDLPFKKINSSFLSSSISYNDKSKKEFIEWCNSNLSGKVFKNGMLYFYENISDIELLEKYCKSSEYVFNVLPYHISTNVPLDDKLINDCTQHYGLPLYPDSVYPTGMLKFNQDAKWDFIYYVDNDDDNLKSYICFKHKSDAMNFKLRS